MRNPEQAGRFHNFRLSHRLETLSLTTLRLYHLLDAKASDCIRRLLVSLVKLLTVPGIYNKGRRAYLVSVRRTSCLYGVES